VGTTVAGAAVGATGDGFSFSVTTIVTPIRLVASLVGSAVVVSGEHAVRTNRIDKNGNSVTQVE
jgi:hypothetical protein